MWVFSGVIQSRVSLWTGSHAIVSDKSWRGGGGPSYTWRWGGTSALLTPVFWHFPIPLAPFFMPNSILLTPLSAEKICLPLSHSVPEIIWPKVGLNFHKNLSFDHFEAFVPIFSLTFDLIDPFFCSSYIFLTPHFYKTSDPVGSIFSSPAPRATACLVSFHLG